MISYEDIEKAQATRATKNIIKSKGKYNRKHKSITLEADESGTDIEAEPEILHTAKKVITGKRKRGRKRKSAILEADEPEPEPEPEPDSEQEVAQTIEAVVPFILKHRPRRTGSLEEG